ncbi:MAG: helix-turn-helix domain-containing protein [Thiohalocapsa sp.]
MTTNQVLHAFAQGLLTEREAAALLNISHRTLQAWRLRGGGPEYVKLGNAVRYDRGAIDRFISERTRSNTAA